MSSVQGTVGRNWRSQAEPRGHIVVAPAAPDGDLFFEEGARVFPEFLTKPLADYKVDGGKFHIAGMAGRDQAASGTVSGARLSSTVRGGAGAAPSNRDVGDGWRGAAVRPIRGSPAGMPGPVVGPVPIAV
jgi:hypothetical protein